MCTHVGAYKDMLSSRNASWIGLYTSQTFTGKQTAMWTGDQMDFLWKKRTGYSTAQSHKHQTLFQGLEVVLNACGIKSQLRNEDG